jgi:hypothetical protein
MLGDSKPPDSAKPDSAKPDSVESFISSDHLFRLPMSPLHITVRITGRHAGQDICKGSPDASRGASVRRRLVRPNAAFQKQAGSFERMQGIR